MFYCTIRITVNMFHIDIDRKSMLLSTDFLFE